MTKPLKDPTHYPGGKYWTTMFIRGHIPLTTRRILAPFFAGNFIGPAFAAREIEVIGGGDGFTEDSVNKLLDEQGGRGDLLLLDPPYLLHESSRRHGIKGVYKDFDHKALFTKLQGRRGWILLYNDSQEIRDLYDGYGWFSFFGGRIVIWSHDLQVRAGERRPGRPKFDRLEEKTT